MKNVFSYIIRQNLGPIKNKHINNPMNERDPVLRKLEDILIGEQ